MNLKTLGKAENIFFLDSGVPPVSVWCIYCLGAQEQNRVSCKTTSAQTGKPPLASHPFQHSQTSEKFHPPQNKREMGIMNKIVLCFWRAADSFLLWGLILSRENKATATRSDLFSL